jgi:hypothetical protein
MFILNFITTSKLVQELRRTCTSINTHGDFINVLSFLERNQTVKYQDFARNSGFWVPRTYTSWFTYKKGKAILITGHGDP